MNIPGPEQSYEAKHLKMIARHNAQVTAILNAAADRLAGIIKTAGTTKGREWNAALRNRIMAALRDASNNTTIAIEEAAASHWELAEMKYDELVEEYTDGIDVPPKIMKSLHPVNTAALNAFLNRSINGMGLSARVWDYTKANAEYLRVYVGSGITTGRSAAKISRDVRQLLREPDKLFRRVRDPKTGKLMLSKAAKAYHPGPGVYRSSYKNALRMTATETNMAYRLSGHTRRMQLPFVKGVKVALSAAHDIIDICDEMIGVYPPGFVFIGWHPWCKCHETSVLASRDEFREYLKTRKMSGHVDSIPARAQRHVKASRKQWRNSYWYKENFTQKDAKLKQSVFNKPGMKG